MARKNTFSIAGGDGRLDYHTKNGGIDVRYLLINSTTKKPFTYGEVVQALLERQNENPALSVLVNPWLEKYKDKNPDSVFNITKHGSSLEDAKTKFMKERYRDLEALASLLFLPLYKRNLACGNITVDTFVCYNADVLYCNKDPLTRKRMMGILNRVIRPVIGNTKLKDLDEKGNRKALKKIKREFSKGKSSSPSPHTISNIKSAYLGLVECINQSGWKGCDAGLTLIHLLGKTSKPNRSINDVHRAEHLDANQRSALLKLLVQQKKIYELFLLGLLYSGLSENEIAAACYGDFQVKPLNTGACYLLLVYKTKRKSSVKNSTISATNEDFLPYKLRWVVLYPWVAELLLQLVELLRETGKTDQEIAAVPLFEQNPKAGAYQLAGLLEPFLTQAGLTISSVIRTARDGTPYLDLPQNRLKEYNDLLTRDAKYVAQWCGVGTIMLHSMFGISPSETDEASYVDTLSDWYSVALYQRLRRWSPFKKGALPGKDMNTLTGYHQVPSRHILRVTNPTNQPITLKVSSSYAINITWKP